MPRLRRAKAEYDLDNLFTYHPPTGNQVNRYQELRKAARVFAEVILKNTRYCADQSAAMRKLRECVMTANAAIALEPAGEQLQLVRTAILEAIGGETTQYRVVRIRKGAKGVKEVAKYVCKGVAMNNRTAKQTHPLLAAMIEAAYRGRKLAIQYGDWKGLGVSVADDDEYEWHCPVCGTERFSWHYHDKTTGRVVVVPQERNTS